MSAPTSQIPRTQQYEAAATLIDEANITLPAILRLKKAGYDFGIETIDTSQTSGTFYSYAGRYKDVRGIATGFSFESRSEAFTKTAYELVERICWLEHAHTATEMRHGSQSSIRPSLRLETLSGIAPELRSSDPALIFGTESLFDWVDAEDVASESTIAIPRQLIEAHKNVLHEPLLRFSNTNGIAAHTTPEQAQHNAVLELIERDACMISFHNRIIPKRIAISALPNETRMTLCALTDAGFSIDVLTFVTDFPTYVIGVIARHSDGPAFAFGAKAHHDLHKAIDGALTESIGVWTLARNDRRYMLSVRSGLLRAQDRLAYWAHQEHAPKLSWMWSGEMTEPQHHIKGSMQHIREHVQIMRIQIATRIISSQVFHKNDFFVVAATSPDLIPIHLDSSPAYTYGERLRSIAQRFGAPHHVSPPPYPHPFP